MLLDPVENALNSVTVTQNKTREDDENLYGAENAIDGDLATWAHIARPSGNLGWFRVELGGVFCIKQILHYFDNDRNKVNTHTCSSERCECEGDRCVKLPLKVVLSGGSGGSGGSGDTSPPDQCILGDMVHLEHPPGTSKFFQVNEIVIITNPSDETSDETTDDNADDNSGEYPVKTTYLLLI